MKIATFKVPALDKTEVIEPSTLIEGLKVWKVIGVQMAFEKAGKEKWWNVIVMYEPPYSPPQPPPLTAEEKSVKKALEKWVEDAWAVKNLIKKNMVALNKNFLLENYKDILEEINKKKYIRYFGQKKLELYGQELHDVIKQAVTEAYEKEKEEKED